MKSIFTLLLVILFSISSFAEVSALEKSALIQFYKSTNGASWTSKWNLSQPVANWSGVTLLNNKVVAINLPNNNLSGNLPNEICNLEFLTTLNLFKNNISGSIPSSIGTLKSLEVLNISFNKLSGNLPVEISREPKKRD